MTSILLDTSFLISLADPGRVLHAVARFNIDHAMTTGLLMRSFTRDDGDDRTAVKDDVKLIAQAVCESITHVLTDDKNTLAKYIDRLRAEGRANLRAIVLSNGFDAAWLNNGQTELPA